MNADLRYDEQLDALVVTSYSAAQQVLHGPGWVSDLAANLELVAGLRGAAELPPLLETMLELFMDGPAHDRFRKLVAPSFSARRIEALRPRIAEIAMAGVVGVSEMDGEEFDLLNMLAYPVPVAVMAELLGVGLEGAKLINETAPRMTGLLESDPTERQLLDAGSATMDCATFLLPLLDERRADPGADFVSELLLADDDGTPLELDEVLAVILLLLIAGQETTATLIGNGVLDVLRHPAEKDRLRHDPGPVVQEILRLDPPLRTTGRQAAADQHIGGVLVPAGQKVLVHLSAANRDPARFTEPDRFDSTRADAGHVAFGGGAHFCLGAALARVETEEVLRHLMRGVPTLTLADPDPPRRPSETFHALERLPVRS